MYRDEIDMKKFKQLGQIEVAEFLKVLEPLGIEFAYITVRSQTTNIEIYAQGFYEDSFKNSVPGTFLVDGVTDSTGNV